MSPRVRLRSTVALGALLSVPAVRTYLDGAIAIDSAAIRVFVAMAFALLVVSAFGALLQAYAPPPAEPEPDPAIEDAVMVDDAGESIAEEPPL
jgi:hypothetical protein